jgi:Domain of unknown function (DUF4382)
MKVHKLSIYLLIAASFLMITACGGGGGGGSAGSGELAIDITDAKPLLPDGVTNFLVTITEVLVHGSGGGWESLPLPETPHTIDLLQFSDGITTELVSPVMLTARKYTQIRLVLAEDGAKIKFKDDPTEYPVVIPPEHLKTDKNFDFDVENGGAVDLLIDFDLSQSLVVTDDGSGTLSYKLKPVLHIVDFFEAATITGIIADTSFAGIDASITVLDINDEVYTKLSVERDEPNNVEFNIFWLVPNKNYRVEIVFDPDLENGPEFKEDVSANNLGPGKVWYLNDENPPNDEGAPI